MAFKRSPWSLGTGMRSSDVNFLALASTVTISGLGRLTTVVSRLRATSNTKRPEI